MGSPTRLVPVEVILTDLVPPDGQFWTDETMYDPQRRIPSFRMAEAANIFFGWSKQKLRRHLQVGQLVLDGQDLAVPRDASGYHVWRLCDIERAAHALLQNGYLQVELFERVIAIVKLVAQNYNYLLPSPVTTQIVPNSNEVRRKALMATEILQVVNDDLDGKPDAKTRRFSVEGINYQIDLTDENWAGFNHLIQSFIEAARPDPTRSRRLPSPEETAERTKIRDWAIEQKMHIGARGRIPQEIVKLYQRAHKEI